MVLQVKWKEFPSPELGTISIQEDVFRLKVPVDDVEPAQELPTSRSCTCIQLRNHGAPMQVLNRQQNLTGIESGKAKEECFH